MSIEPDGEYTITQAHEELDIPLTTLHSAHQRGNLTPFRVFSPRVQLYRGSDLLRFAAERRTKQRQPRKDETTKTPDNEGEQ